MSIEIIGMVGTKEVDWDTELVPLLREQAASTPAGTEAALSA